MHKILRFIAFVLAALVLPLAFGGINGMAARQRQYAPLRGAAAGTVPPLERAHDPAKPTAVVVVSNNGAEVSDVLAPFEVLATTGAFNVYTVAPQRRVVPLTGGLHLVPDLSFAELEARVGAGRAPDVVMIPAMPDAGKSSVEPVIGWLRQQADRGALMVGVCAGAHVLAATGLLDGRPATSHWARLGDLDEVFPDVEWVHGTRYVDDGEVITTGGLLSNVDGSLRVVERLVGAGAARRTADAVGWPYYSPGTPASIPELRLGPDAVLYPLNIAYRRTATGVLLTDDIREMELASLFDTHTGQSYATRTVAVAVDDDTVTTRHGMTFVPVADLQDAGDDLDRLVVPGADPARRQDADLAAYAQREHGLTPEYLHAEPGFPYAVALRDLARTADVPTARWSAKVLEYPVGDLDLSGPALPWPIILTPLVLALAGLAVAGGVVALVRHRRGEGGSGGGPTATAGGAADRPSAAPRAPADRPATTHGTAVDFTMPVPAVPARFDFPR